MVEGLRITSILIFFISHAIDKENNNIRSNVIFGQNVATNLIPLLGIAIGGYKNIFMPVILLNNWFGIINRFYHKHFQEII